MVDIVSTFRKMSTKPDQAHTYRGVLNYEGTQLRAAFACASRRLIAYGVLDQADYLARDVAATFQKRLLRQADVVRCPAQLRGGADSQSIGVVLDFEEVHL
jgi:hypothetical protein